MGKSKIIKPSIGIYCVDQELGNIQPLIDFADMLKWRSMASEVLHPGQLFDRYTGKKASEEECREHIEQIVNARLLIVAVTMRLLASRFYWDELREIIHKKEDLEEFIAAHLSIHPKEASGINGPLVPDKPIHDFSPQTKGWLEVNKAVLAKVEAMNSGG